MNRQLVENILAVIKTSTDKSVIVKGLTKLRTDVVKDKNGILLFREAGGVAPIVRFLSKPHEQILEVALSIMGNCCTDEQSCREALENKIAIPLATILKSIPNPVIQCRACRLLGNLAKVDANQLVSTHCPAMAQALCRIIEDASDVQTRMMAFRACRFLLVNTQFLKHFLHSSGFTILLRILTAIMKNESNVVEEKLLSDAQAPLKVGLKRNQHREKYFEEVARNLEGVRSDIFDHEVLKNSTRNSNAYLIPEERAALDLVCEILKCLLVISELQINAVVWESLNRASCTLAPIVYFITDEKKSKHRSAALKILSNLSKNHGAFYILSSADAILAACELLVADDDLSESERRHCIHIISILSTDACNRSKIRRSGALRKFIAMVKGTAAPAEKASILNVLVNFQYDNMSMDLMLREGLVIVLIKELDIYLTSDEEYYKKKRDEKLQSTKKRKLPELVKESKCKFAKVREETYLDSDSPSSSPRSYNAPSSPCSSRSMSPVGGGHLYRPNHADSDEESYSPVCSDEEEDDDDGNETARDTSSHLYNNPNANSNDHTIIMNLLDLAARSEEDSILIEDEEEVSQDVPAVKLPQLGNLTHNTIDVIDNLLFRVTCLVKKSVDLGKPETMNTLIKALNLFGINTDFAGSLTNILLESQFFVNVIKQGISHQLYQLTKVKEVPFTNKDGFGFLETLTSVSECNYGKEELARLLRSDDVASQKRAAITVGYLIRSKPLLYQFLNDGNALTLLLSIILSSKQDEFTAEAVDALTCMSRYTLGIVVPQLEVDKRLDEYDEFVENAGQTLHENCDMRFVVHPPPSSESDTTNTADSSNLLDNVESSKTATAIGFNKAMLCSTSEVFNTMLNSDFREGKEGEIHLRNYTVSGLRYFLNLIVRQSKNLKYNIPPANQYYALLEAFEMARIYIIPEMEAFVLKLLIALLDETNCLNVLEWSMKNYHVELTEMAINYYLCSPLSTEAKVNLFRTADYSTYSTEWFQMIMEAILARCRNGF